MVEISPLPTERLDELLPAFLALHRHHQEVSMVPVHEDEQLAWRLRRQVYADTLAGGRGFVLAAVEDGLVIGYAVVFVHPEADDTFPYRNGHGEIYSLSVLPEQRGRGIGSRLLDRVDQELAARGITDLAIGVLTGNDGAIRLYQRRGLVPGELMLYRIAGD